MTLSPKLQQRCDDVREIITLQLFPPVPLVWERPG